MYEVLVRFRMAEIAEIYKETKMTTDNRTKATFDITDGIIRYCDGWELQDTLLAMTVLNQKE